MKIIIFPLIFIIIPLSVFSQGFDWQNSYRLQNSNSVYFIGFYSEFGLMSNTGKIPYNEGSFSCCEFESGKGNYLSIGMIGEYWLSGLGALNISLGFLQTNSFFSDQRQVPRREYLLITNYELDATVNYITTAVNIKKRIFETNSWYSFGFNINTFLYENLIFNEIKDSKTPKDDPFKNRFNIPNAQISDFNFMNFRLLFGIGYDLDLFLGYYLSISTGIDLPLNSYLNDCDWNSINGKINFRIFRNL